jgi:hypothetical protein
LVKAVQRVAMVGAFAIFIVGAFFTPQLVVRQDVPVVPQDVPAAQAETPLKPAADAYPVADEPPTDRDPESGEGFTDLYGNEISDAIATYTFDQSGSLYELHSPQTELPRLGIPKS